MSATHYQEHAAHLGCRVHKYTNCEYYNKDYKVFAIAIAVTNHGLIRLTFVIIIYKYLFFIFVFLLRIKFMYLQSGMQLHCEKTV